MENMDKYEYIESMNVETWMFFSISKKRRLSHTWEKKVGGETTYRPWFFSYVTANKHVFLCLKGAVPPSGIRGPQSIVFIQESTRANPGIGGHFQILPQSLVSPDCTGNYIISLLSQICSIFLLINLQDNYILNNDYHRTITRVYSELYSWSHLTFTNIKYTDSGLYTCEAQNRNHAIAFATEVIVQGRFAIIHGGGVWNWHPLEQ